MAAVEFVDTSVLLNLLRVPGKSQQREEVRETLRQKVGDGVNLILPIATVIETGNHVAQVRDGDARRRCAVEFVVVLRQVAAGNAPWILHEIAWNGAMLEMLCDGVRGCGSFPELASSGLLGTGDLSILAERERYLARAAVGEVRIWTYDGNLAAYS